MFYRVTFTEEVFVEADSVEDAKEKALDDMLICSNKYLNDVEQVSEIFFNVLNYDNMRR